MPTVDEFEELINNCTWEWTTLDGVNGYNVTSKKTGNSIFLPITGFRYYADTQFRSIMGVYWTSSLYTGNPNKAWCLEFNFSDIKVHYGNLSSNRFSGRELSSNTDLQLVALLRIDSIALEDTWTTTTVAKAHDGTIET